MDPQMIQESVSWDSQNLIREPSIRFQVYLLFLIVVCGTTIMKLARIWWTAPPFSSSRRASDPVYLKLLRTSSRSLSQWIGCTFLAWGILVSTTLYELSSGMMNEKVTGRLIILLEIRDFSTALCMALFVFLVRWHVLARIDLYAIEAVTVFPPENRR
jgi:hypothetical protein